MTNQFMNLIIQNKKLAAEMNDKNNPWDDPKERRSFLREFMEVCLQLKKFFLFNYNLGSYG